MRKFIVSIIVLAAAAAGWYFFYPDAGDEAPAYRLAKIERGSIVHLVSSTGTLSAVITVQVGSQVSGQIKELLADFNTEVKAGQIIARIDPVNFEARLRQAEAELAVAKANVAIQEAVVERTRAELENARSNLAAARAQVDKAQAAVTDAEQEYERKRALFKKAAVSKREIDQARAARDQAVAQLKTAQAQLAAQAQQINSRQAQLKMAQAQVMHARAQVEQRRAVVENARIDLEQTIIRSPVNGVVIERNVDVGQTVAASLQAPTLFTIAKDLRQMQVEASLDEADIGGIQVGQRASFTVDAYPDRTFTGIVEQIRMASKTVQNVVTYTVVISAENRDLRLLPGMTASVQIVVDERRDVLKAPNAALRFKPAGETGSTGRPADQAFGGRAAAEERFKRLSRALALTEDQQARLRERFVQGRRKIMTLRQAGASAEEIKAEIEALRRRNRQAVETILTPKQLEAYRRLTARREVNPIRPGTLWVLGRDGKPEPAPVMIGVSDGQFTEIVRGEIEAGQEVIVGRRRTGTKKRAGGRRFRF